MLFPVVLIPANISVISDIPFLCSSRSLTRLFLYATSVGNSFWSVGLFSHSCLYGFHLFVPSAGISSGVNTASDTASRSRLSALRDFSTSFLLGSVTGLDTYPPEPLLKSLSGI